MDGKNYDGNVRLENGQWVVGQNDGKQVKIDTNNVLQATIADGNFNFTSPRRPAGEMHRGVMFRGGAIVAANLVSADDSTVVFNTRGKDYRLPTARVARLIFRNTTAAMEDQIPPGRVGALLVKGDFFEGDFKSFNGGLLKLDSVLFGPMNFDANGATVLMALADPEIAPAACTIRGRDGSVWLADMIRVDRDRLEFEEKSLGPVSLHFGEIVDVRMTGGRTDSLADLKPQPLDASSRFAIDATTAGVPMTLGGGTFRRGVSVSAGSAVRFDLAGKYDRLMASVGVPAEIVPVAKVRVVVLGDGKEIWASEAATSLSPPQELSVSVAGVKELLVRVVNRGDEAGASILFGDPVLVRR